MKRLALFTMTAAVVGAALAPQAAAKPDAVVTLVAKCTTEASASHEEAWRMVPALRPAIEAHRDLMFTACARFLSEEKTEVLLAQCVAQAAAGPRHLRNGRDIEQPRIERQQELCHRIATLRASDGAQARAGVY